MPDTELQVPVSGFTIDVTIGDAPLAVTLTNTSTGTVIGYSWSFGDGNVSSDENPTHTYANPGNYTLSLTVFNEAGSNTSIKRIDVTAPATTTQSSCDETVGELISGVRSQLRRPADQKLPYTDIMDVLNDLLRGYSRDLHLSEQDHRTDEAQCTINQIDGNDHILTVAGINEVEPMALRYAASTDVASNSAAVSWREVTIVPLDYFSERSVRDSAVASFFGGLVVDNGVKIKLNLGVDTVEKSVFWLRYRVPYVRVLRLCSKVSLPSDFIPMLKQEAAMLSLPRIRDNSEDFYKWRRANEPIFAANIANWRQRWQKFLDTSMEPNHAPKIAANDYRRVSRSSPRYLVERR
jgi:PKD repeat protein